MAPLLDITGKDRIDVHVHIVLDRFSRAVQEMGGDPAGWVTPAWSPEAAIKQMDTIGVKKQVFSVTYPGPAIVGANQAGRDLTRELNEEQADICKRFPDRFDFFASVPDLVDVEGAVAEINYSLTTLKAAGIVLMTGYQDRLLGDPLFAPVWAALEEHKAIVFIHPGAITVLPNNIAGVLPQPTIDFPFHTTRTAVDLVLTRTIARHPSIKVILSHAGGALPFLADRVIKSLDIPLIQDRLGGMPVEDVLRDFGRFWLDVAVSTSRAQLYGLLAFTTPDKILFGSDFPYAPVEFGVKTTRQLDEFIRDDPMGKLLAGVNSENAKALLGW